MANHEDADFRSDGPGPVVQLNRLAAIPLAPDICHAKLVPEREINEEAFLAKLPAADAGPGASAAGGSGFRSPNGPSAFQRELDRARRHLAKLEAEQKIRTQQTLHVDEPARFDESPAFVRTCNILIWAIIIIPVALALIAFVRRLAG